MLSGDDPLNYLQFPTQLNFPWSFLWQFSPFLLFLSYWEVCFGVSAFHIQNDCFYLKMPRHLTGLNEVLGEEGGGWKEG